MTYTEESWAEELQTYTSVEQVVDETLEGLNDQIQSCTTGNVMTVPTSGPQPRPPFATVYTVCSRGSRGCDRIHNDLTALKFSKMALDRIKEML
jgi:hypothetical protein